MTPPDRVRVALAHLAPNRSRPQDNRAALIAAIEDAARRGADLVLAPELAVAGYGFRSDEEARAVAEPRLGPTLDALTRVCASLRVWCAAGYLERDERSGGLFNSALFVGPGGLVGHHRKVVAETSWATRGAPSHMVPIPTPWGPIGLLICADSYYSGPARALTLRGAEALFVLANWPTGDLDPRRIWRARAAENGRPVLVANRTGVDGRFDARTGVTAIYDAAGRTRTEHRCEHPGLVVKDVPLRSGRWVTKPDALSGRRPSLGRFRQVDLPAAEAAVESGATPERRPATLVRLLPGGAPEVPAGAETPALVISAPGVNLGPGLAPVVMGCDTEGIVVFVDGVRHRPAPGERGVIANAGALRVAGVELRDALHPEVTLALAARGVELIAVPADRHGVQEIDRVLLRSLDRTAVAVVTPGGAQVETPPWDHGAPETIRSLVPLDVTLTGGWSSPSGSSWDTAHSVDWGALCRSAP